MAVRTLIEADTTIGTVRLTVADLERSRTFYEQSLGLLAAEREGGVLALAAAEGEPPLIELHGEPSALPLDRRATGLYHVAILMPSRVDLAKSLRRIADSGSALEGASDHLVSEALYLSDPDGTGIEVYRDRARDEWPRADGQLEMATAALDIHDLLSELRADDREQATVPADTRIGHVHLQVSDLEASENFYSGVLGFDVTVRGYPGALFVSAGGYHHHIGLNTWHSAGSGPPPPGSVGLRSFEIELPDRGALEAALDRVRSAGVELEDADGGALVRDPSGNGVLLVAR